MLRFDAIFITVRQNPISIPIGNRIELDSVRKCNRWTLLMADNALGRRARTVSIVYSEPISMTVKNSVAISLGLDSKISSLKIALGVLVLFAGSQIAIPLEPVPITMQTVAVMLIGLLYPRRAGLWTVILYTVLGGMGLPMFQGFEGGLSHLYGPTAGYIFGFIVSVYVMATLREKFNLDSYAGILANCIIGTVVVFACGISWLAAVIGLRDALSFGLIPFIIPGAVKAILLSGAVRYIRGTKS